MDPNANLKEQIELAMKMMADYESEESNGIDQDDAERLAELVMALHGWLKGGGFLPDKWKR